MESSENTLGNIQELLKSSIFLKQQLRGEEIRRRSNTANNQSSSVYKRLSGTYDSFDEPLYNSVELKCSCFFFPAHIQTTLDLPDLDFSGALRETTSRMENIMGSTSRATSSTQNPSRKSSSGSTVVGEGFQRSHTTLH